MKETIKKSLVWGLVFSLTSLTVFLVYATGVFNLPSTATTWTALSSAEWNKMVGSLDYLKTTNDSLQTQVNALNAKFTPEVWITPTLLNWWVNYLWSANNTWYYKDWLWIVRFKWLIKNWTIWTCAFILPVWYKPISTYVFWNLTAITWITIGRVDIQSDWCVLVYMGWNTRASLDWISFRAEQ